MYICDAGYISDGVYMGSAPCPRIGSVAKWGTEPLDATAIRGAEPNQEDASCLGVPKPHISDGVYLGVAQAPRCIWGAPHAPKTGRCRYSGSRTPFFIFLFSFFNFNSIPHDAKHQLGRHGVLQTTY